MNILVTGGAGYVGSIVSEEMVNQGHKVIVVDDLQQGHRDAVPKGAEFILANIADNQAIDNIFRNFKIDAVMHMAAETVVEYSMSDPKRYFQNNVVRGISLLDIMLEHDVNKLIFSSSAAVYGEPETVPIPEEHSKKPLNSYGESKLMFEQVLAWYGKAYGLKHISLRYFNAAGASEHIGEDHSPETHLIPNVLKAVLDKSMPVAVFGTDYPTRDGSCVRDYVHVIDIARAHILALEKLDKLSGSVYNLGNGNGYSVLEVVKGVEKVAGSKPSVKIGPRRRGDPAILVASSDKARAELGWNPAYSKLESIIESAWQWIQKHPDGYEQ